MSEPSINNSMIKKEETQKKEGDLIKSSTN